MDNLNHDVSELWEKERELSILAARASTAELGQQVFTGGKWLPLWYIDVVAAHLDACLRYARGLPMGLSRLCINLPFQHAKSTIVQMFIARALGVDPSLRIVNGTYSVLFARESIDYVQRWMSNPIYQAAFPTRFGQAATVDDDGSRKSLDKVRNTANAFQVRRLNSDGKLENLGGSYLSTSLGASLNGRPYDIGIVDDPHKDMEDAESEPKRRHVEDRYDAIFMSRMQQRSVQIIVTSRMGMEDLVNHVVPRWAKYGIPHAVLRFPAILDEEPASYDPRPQGHGLAQALYPGGPEKYDAEWYRRQRAEIMDKSPHIWETCYQQRPMAREGSLFQDSWWRYYDPADLTEVDKFWVSIDCASKAAGASWTCADLWASKGPAAFKLDELRGHWDVRQFERELMTWITDKWGREVRRNGSAILIEDGGYGRTIHDDLVAAGVNSMHLLGTGGLSKQARASLALDFVRNGLAFLPSRSFGRTSVGWVGEHKAEYARFPQPPCDRVDAGTQALRWHIDWLRGPGD